LQAPESDDDAGNTRDRLDERRHGAANRRGRELAEIKRDAERKRRGEEERAETGDGRAVDEVSGAVKVVVAVPAVLVDEETETERRHRELRALDELVRDHADDDQN